MIYDVNHTLPLSRVYLARRSDDRLYSRSSGVRSLSDRFSRDQGYHSEDIVGRSWAYTHLRVSAAIIPLPKLFEPSLSYLV
jgi:hypothetical protein